MLGHNFSAERIREIGARLLEIQDKRHRLIPTTLWVSDLHGEGDKFIQVLRGRFGMLYTTCQEALAEEDEFKIKQVTRLIRQKEWTPDLGLSREQAIVDLLTLVQYKAGDDLEQREKLQEHSLASLLLKAFRRGGIPEAFLDQEELFRYSVRHLSESILLTIPDHIVILGDIFDRGASPDKIIRTLNLSFLKKKTSVIWGNHDILWFGAAAGAESLIAETMRITTRYGHLSVLDRLKIDYRVLRDFALKTYPPNQVGASFKAKDPACRSMEKALAILQFKLEERTIGLHPEYTMESRLWLNRLATLLKKGTTEDLIDTHFPTLNLNNPQELSEGEVMVMNILKYSWLNSRPLKRLMGFILEKARIYNPYQGFLNMHALIPSTTEGEFDSFLGYKGKALLDFFQQVIDRVGKRYLYEGEQKEEDLSLLFYLWCGPKSPLFGKDAMKTFERYFLKDKSTHKETSLFWEKNLRLPAFRERVKKEFGVQRVIYGHTPRDVTKGDKIVTEDGFAINIDGGFSGAYLNRGHALVRTPRNLYGIILPTTEEADQIINENQALPLMVEMVEQLPNALLVKDLHEGDQLALEWDDLLDEMRQLTKAQMRIFSSAMNEY